MQMPSYSWRVAKGSLVELHSHVGSNNGFLLHGDVGSSSGAGGASRGRGSLDDLFGSELVTESSMLGTEGLHSSVVGSSSSAEVAESDHSDVFEVSGSAHSSQASGMGTSSGVVLSTSVEGQAFSMSTFTGKVSFPSSKGGHSLVVGSASSVESSQVSAMSGESSGVVGSNSLEVSGSLSSGSGKSLGMSTSVGVVSSASESGHSSGVSASLGVVFSQAAHVSGSHSSGVSASLGVVFSQAAHVSCSLSSGSRKSLGMSTSVGEVSSTSVSGHAFGVSASLGVVFSQAAHVSGSLSSEVGLHSASVSGNAFSVRPSGFSKVAHLGCPSLVHCSLLAHPVLA